MVVVKLDMKRVILFDKNDQNIAACNCVQLFRIWQI